MSIKENSKLANFISNNLKEVHGLDTSIVEGGGFNGLQSMFLIALYNTDFDCFRTDKICKAVKKSGYVVHNMKIIEDKLIELRNVEEKSSEQISHLAILEKFDKLMKIALATSADYTDINLSKYMNGDFTFMQVFQILLNLMSSLDPSKYAKPEYSSTRMRVIELAMLNGFDLEKYTNLALNDRQLYEMYFKEESERDSKEQQSS